MNLKQNIFEEIWYLETITGRMFKHSEPICKLIQHCLFTCGFMRKLNHSSKNKFQNLATILRGHWISICFTKFCTISRITTSILYRLPWNCNTRPTSSLFKLRWWLQFHILFCIWLHINRRLCSLLTASSHSCRTNSVLSSKCFKNKI